MNSAEGFGASGVAGGADVAFCAAVGLLEAAGVETALR